MRAPARDAAHAVDGAGVAASTSSAAATEAGLAL